MARSPDPSARVTAGEVNDGLGELFQRIEDILEAFDILVDCVGNCCDCFTSNRSVRAQWAKEVYERELGKSARTRRPY